MILLLGADNVQIQAVPHFLWLSGAVIVGVSLAHVLLLWQWREWRVRRYLDNVRVLTGLGDGVIAGVPLIQASTAINGHVIDALGRLKIHSTDTATIFQHFRVDHADLVSQHFVDQLKGYVAESIAGDHYAALGHHVVMATTTNQAGWDLLIDGHPFQVKSGATAAQKALEHLDKHPDIPVITDPQAFAHVSSVDPGDAIALHDIVAAKLQATTEGTLHGMDTLAHAGALHVPVITLAVSSYSEIVRLSRGHTGFSIALTHVVTDAAGVGVGIAAGAKVGVAIGTVGGPHVAAALGFLGGVVGGIGGKLVATFAKEAHLRSLAKQYDEQVRLASVQYELTVRDSRFRFSRYVRRLKSAFERTQLSYTRDYRKEQRIRDGSVLFCRKKMQRAARRLGLQAELQTAIEDLCTGNNDHFRSIICRAEAAGDADLVAALGLYIALHRELEGVLAGNLIAYEKMRRTTDQAGRSEAAYVLQGLAGDAKAIFAECDSLRNEIEKELLKLGKPLPSRTVQLDP